MRAIAYPYLGSRRLPLPTGDVTSPPDMGDNATKLLSGRIAVQKRLNARRAWNLPYDFLPPRDAELLNGFYLGMYGRGPFPFVDPSQENVLDFDVSTCGARSFAPLGWISSTGALGRAAGAPEEVADSGVVTWTTPAMGRIMPGTVLDHVDPLTAPVYLPGEPLTVSLYAKVATALTATLALLGFDATGTVNDSTITKWVALTTGWQRISISVAPGIDSLSSSVFVMPRLALDMSTTTLVSLCAPQIRYADEATCWRHGSGSPRVVITSTPGRTVPRLGWSNHVLQVAE